MDVTGHVIAIVREDNIVIVDGLAMPVDCSSLIENIHAVSWYGDNGEIEFTQPSPAILVGYAPVYLTAPSDMDEFMPLLDAWGVALVKAKAEEAARAEALRIEIAKVQPK
jgi:hypothetical protein